MLPTREQLRLLLERGEGGGGIQAIPATLQQSLMARLDRLGPAREVAQIGSVIGRGFSYGLLHECGRDGRRSPLNVGTLRDEQRLPAHRRHR